MSHKAWIVVTLGQSPQCWRWPTACLSSHQWKSGFVTLRPTASDAQADKNSPRARPGEMRLPHITEARDKHSQVLSAYLFLWAG